MNKTTNRATKSHYFLSSADVRTCTIHSQLSVLLVTVLVHSCETNAIRQYSLFNSSYCAYGHLSKRFVYFSENWSVREDVMERDCLEDRSKQQLNLKCFSEEKLKNHKNIISLTFKNQLFIMILSRSFSPTPQSPVSLRRLVTGCPKRQLRMYLLPAHTKLRPKLHHCCNHMQKLWPDIQFATCTHRHASHNTHNVYVLSTVNVLAASVCLQFRYAMKLRSAAANKTTQGLSDFLL